MSPKPINDRRALQPFLTIYTLISIVCHDMRVTMRNVLGSQTDQIWALEIGNYVRKRTLSNRLSTV